MSSLREVYEDAWKGQYGLQDSWHVNPEPARHIALGAFGRVRDDGFQTESTLAALGLGRNLRIDPPQTSTPNPWDFKSDRSITVAVTANADVPGAGPVGKANFDVNIGFGKHAGVTIHGATKWFSGYSDMDRVRAVLVKAARDRVLTKGQSIVVTRQLTGHGVMFVSEGHEASIQVRGTASVTPGQLPPISSLSASLGVVSSTGAVRHEVIWDGAVVAMRLLYLGTKGWFWWRRFVAVGVAPGRGPELYEVEDEILTGDEGYGTDDYFALV